MGVLRRIGRPGRAALLLALGAAGGAGALAVASVPDGNGVIHACVLLSDPGQPPNHGPNLEIIDPSRGQTCNTGPGGSEQALSWNVTGPAGPRGPRGSIGPRGAIGPGVTIATPAVKSSAHAIATLRFGTGRDALRTPIQGYSLAKTSGGGKVSVHDISITKKLDKSSPTLSKACATGKHFPTATIVLRKSGGKTYLKIKMSQVIISSYQLGSNGTKPQDHITLSYEKVKYDYKA